MNVVGRVGSLISQGVYSVATPFHPFGGAVDIIVVEQEDGTYRSTPWYICFGKFQGVLKGAEKMVTISVNGVDADFHMYLDNSGKAYFMREVMSGGEEMESNNPSNVYSENKEETENDDQSYRHQDEQSSPQSSSGYGAYHYGSVNEVEDLVKSSEESNSEMVLVSVDGHVLTVPISLNEDNMDNVQLSTPQFHLGPGEGSGEEFGASGDVWEVGLFGELDESMPKNMDALGNQSEVLKDGGEATSHADEVHITVNTDMPNCTENTSAHLNKDEMFKSCLDFTIHAEDSDLHDANFQSVELGRKDDSRCSPGNSTFCKVPVEEQVVARDDSDLRNDSLEPVSIRIKDVEINEVDSKCENDQSAGNCDQPCCNSPLSKNIMIEATEDKTLNTENTLNSPSHDRSTRSVTNDLEDVGSVPGRLPTGEDCRHTETSRLQESICGFGFEISLCGNLIRPGMGRCSAEEEFDAHRISQEEFKESGPSIIKNGNLIVRFEERYFTWDKAAHILIGKAVFGSQFSVEPNDPIPVKHDETPKAGEDPNSISQSYSRKWRLWSIPFRRGKSLHHSDGNSSNEELFLNSESVLQNPNAEQTSNSNNIHSPRKQYSRTNIPTTEQIATLNLKEGQNKITFSFSTRVLGKQEVDAHIYLWKWNARIVISDVDGTITKILLRSSSI